MKDYVPSLTTDNKSGLPVNFGHNLTWDELAAEVAKMSPKQRKMKVLTQDENTGEWVGFCRLCPAEECAEPSGKPKGQLVMLMSSSEE
jgi:hypothetical protein